eukprot:2719479-Amphidinium_carterae.1
MSCIGGYGQRSAPAHAESALGRSRPCRRPAWECPLDCDGHFAVVRLVLLVVWPPLSPLQRAL